MVIWDEIRSVAIMGDTAAAVIVVVFIAFEPVFELEEDPFTFFIAAEVFKYPGKFFEIGRVKTHMYCHLLGWELVDHAAIEGNICQISQDGFLAQSSEMHAKHEHFGAENNFLIRKCNDIADVKNLVGSVLVFAGLSDSGEEEVADVEFVVEQGEIIVFIHNMIHLVYDWLHGCVHYFGEADCEGRIFVVEEVVLEFAEVGG